MVYTQARLEHALKVFRETSSYRDKRGLPSEHLERHLRSKYADRASFKSAPLTNVSIWQDKEDASDDEEYDPRKEKKVVTKKRKKELKRKANDIGGEEKIPKRTKSDKDAENIQNDAYVTLRLSSEKGRRFLQNIGPGRGFLPDSFEDGESSGREPEPSYFNKYLSTKPARRNRRHRELSELEDELTHMYVVEQAWESRGRSALRSGKILERPDVEIEDVKANISQSMQCRDQHVTKMSDRKTAPSLTQPSTLVTTRPVTKDAVDRGSVTTLPATNTTTINQIGTAKDPIVLLDSDEESTSSPVFGSSSFRQAIKHRSAIEQQYPPSPVSLPRSNKSSFSLEDPRKNEVPFYNDDGIITLKTSYAHPIDFRYISPTPICDCDFCADYRTGIIGHGKRVVPVFKDPDNPNQYQEMADGHRSEGKPETKMCPRQAKERLMIMRCHDKGDLASTSDKSPGVSRVGTSAFAKIRNQINSKENMNLYRQLLFDKAPGTRIGAAGSSTITPPLASCSLCPAPAVYECCKWQEQDRRGHPVEVPAMSFSKASSCAQTQPSASVVASPTRIDAALNGQSATYSPTSAWSKAKTGKSSDPDDQRTSDLDKLVPSKGAQNYSTQARPSLIPSIVSAPSSSSPRKASPQASRVSQESARLGQLIRGCGLKVCHVCGVFLEKECDGVLDQKKVMRWLRVGNKLGARADVEWLFRESTLDREYDVSGSLA